ncbi:MAG TPA: chromate transporter [Planctomycetota bacterium]|nr:chromate transporter [Planctomycetota bacterium]
MNTLWRLFVSFALVGVGAYGGGLVAVPLIQHELVDHRQWLSVAEMSKIIAIAQMTPGPVSINAATFVGYRLSGIAGAVAATVAVVLPSIIILIVVSHILDLTRKNAHLWRIRQGLQGGVLSLLLFAVWSYGRGVISDWPSFAIAAGAFILLVIPGHKIHPVLVIVAAGLVGLLVF